MFDSGTFVAILYNDISGMEDKKRMLEMLVPEAKIICGHGKMQKDELENLGISVRTAKELLKKYFFLI